MKLAYLFISLSSFLLFTHAQAQVTFVQKGDKAFEQDKIHYLNLSVSQKLTVDELKPVLIDFSLNEMQAGVDSMVVSTNEKTYTASGLNPFLFEGKEPLENLEIAYFKEGKPLKVSGSEVTKVEIKERPKPLVSDDRIVFGILALVLGLIFYTSHKESAFWKKFYVIVPALLLCYIVPAILDLTGVISQHYSNLYPMARDYLLPAALVLMTLGIDFKAIINLGPKALIMFFAGTLGVILGGPIAILIYSQIDPSVVGGEGFEAAWRGMATIAGSWIGGGANQNAMYETYAYAPQLYGKMIVVDIVVANMWMAFLLWAITRAEKFDKWLKADSTAVEELKDRVVKYQLANSRIGTTTDYMIILGIAFGTVAISHWGGQWLGEFFAEKLSEDSPFASSFFWLVVIATTGGLLLSTTRLRSYDGAGASKLGSVFIYILVATIGMKMELSEAVKEPQLILVGIIWMIIHAGVMFVIAKMIRAPFFFLAVGSKANIGGAASAPIVASAFHPSLASVGALLAVLGYAVGTYGAIVCAELMKWVAP